MAPPRFYVDPLYSYLIAVTYRIAGADVRYVFAWQLTLGILSQVLIWVLARRFFGDLVAICAAAMAAACSLLVYYELLLLRDSLIVFAALALIWLTDQALLRGGWLRFVAVGLGLGLGVCLKSTFVLFAAGIAAAVVVTFRSHRRALVSSMAAMALGIAVALAPLAARNVAVGLPPFTLASNGELTFVLANASSFSPEAGFEIDVPLAEKFLSETNGGWPAAVSTIWRTQTVTGYLAQFWQKWDRIWYWYEIPNNDNFYYATLYAPILAWLPVTWGILAPLALVGLATGVKRIREIGLLYLLVIASVVPLLAFYVLGRFRLALVASAVPFAALAVVYLVTLARERRFVALTATVVVVGGLGVWAGRPLGPEQTLIRTSDWLSPFTTRYQGEIGAALKNQDPAKAAGAFMQFFRYEPSLTAFAESNDPNLARTFAEMHVNCAQMLNESGQAGLAEVQVQRAEAIRRVARLR